MDSSTLTETKQEIGLVGIPVGCGQDKYGAKDGPKSLRAAGLVSSLEALGRPVREYGDVKVDGDPNITSDDAMESDCVGKTSKNVTTLY
ncbi:unnamed protein product [Ixodes hexagonus]